MLPTIGKMILDLLAEQVDSKDTTSPFPSYKKEGKGGVVYFGFYNGHYYINVRSAVTRRST
jgi:hypothetical protein